MSLKFFYYKKHFPLLSNTKTIKTVVNKKLRRGNKYANYLLV